MRVPLIVLALAWSGLVWLSVIVDVGSVGDVVRNVLLGVIVIAAVAGRR